MWLDCRRKLQEERTTKVHTERTLAWRFSGLNKVLRFHTGKLHHMTKKKSRGSLTPVHLSAAIIKRNDLGGNDRIDGNKGNWLQMWIREHACWWHGTATSSSKQHENSIQKIQLFTEGQSWQIFCQRHSKSFRNITIYILRTSPPEVSTSTTDELRVKMSSIATLDILTAWKNKNDLTRVSFWSTRWLNSIDKFFFLVLPNTVNLDPSSL